MGLTGGYFVIIALLIRPSLNTPFAIGDYGGYIALNTWLNLHEQF